MATHKNWKHKSKKHTALFSLILAAILITMGVAILYAGAHFLGGPIRPSSGLTDVAVPERLTIPSIGVDATIQSVGLTDSGRIGIPSNFTDVAWYNQSPKPGESGSAFIDGHLDTATDINAVFIRLGELKPGDEIFVTDKNGEKIKFRVTDSQVYSESDAPREKIFDNTGSIARLNLITCDGVWNQKVYDYSKRLVVYSERVLD